MLLEEIKSNYKIYCMLQDYDTLAFSLLKEILQLDFVPTRRGYIHYDTVAQKWLYRDMYPYEELLNKQFISLREALSVLLEDVKQFCCVMPFGSYVNIDINTEIAYILINTYNQDVEDDSFVTPFDSQLEVSEHLFYRAGIGGWYNDTHEDKVDEYKHKIKLVPELFLKLIRKDYLASVEKSYEVNVAQQVAKPMANNIAKDLTTKGLYLAYLKTKGA